MCEQPAKKRSRNKLVRVASGVGFFVVFPWLILMILGFVIPITKPKYMIQSIIVENLTVSDDKNSPSFNLKLSALLTLKNSNFGSYKFEDGRLRFSYKGSTVGEVAVNKSSVNIFAKKKARVVVNLSSNSVPRDQSLNKDIASGKLTLSGKSRLGGKVEYMKLIKRNKYATLNCTLTINLLGKAIQRLRCG